MARFERRSAADGPVVQGFARGGFSVEGGIYRALLLTPDRAVEWDAPALEALTADALASILDVDPAPEFLILGTGASHRFPPRALIRDLDARGMGLEAMDSRAAARTWGLLRGEERWIVAALMPIG
ncbi:MAG: Mth938-like domain-containing protein [Sphingomonadales bacterium]